MGLEYAAQADQSPQRPPKLVIGKRRPVMVVSYNCCLYSGSQRLFHTTLGDTMATTRHATHTRANMYGLARHAKHYERWAGLLATPLYRRVVADVAAAQLPVGGTSRRRHRSWPGSDDDCGAMPTAVGVRHRPVAGDDRPGHRRRLAGVVIRSSSRWPMWSPCPSRTTRWTWSCPRSACTTGTTRPPGCATSSGCCDPALWPGSTISARWSGARRRNLRPGRGPAARDPAGRQPPIQPNRPTRPHPTRLYR